MHKNAVQDTQQSLSFINLLRCGAVFLVIWAHLIANFTTSNKVSWQPVKIVREYVTQPLGIIQDFGFFGVVLFFIISGFIITYVAQRENTLSFITKRVFRIYPTYILSLVVILLANFIYTSATGLKSLGDRNFEDFLWASSLLHLVRIPANSISGVAWTLIIEVIFYILCAIFLGFIKNRPRLAMLCILGSVIAILVPCKNFGPNYFLFAISVSYVPFLLMGQLLYYFWSKRIKLWEFGLLWLLIYGTIMYTIENLQPRFYQLNNSYPITFMYAYVVFVIGLVLNERIRVPRVIEFYSRISYSVYLYHGGVGLLILSYLKLNLKLNYTLSLAVTLVLVTLVSYLSWRFMESPSQNFARYLLRRWKNRKKPKPEPVKEALEEPVLVATVSVESKSSHQP